MRTDPVIAILVAVIGPVATTLIGIVGLSLNEWRQHRDRERRRRVAVRQAGEDVAFIRLWFQAYELVSSPEVREEARRRVENDLDRAYAVFIETPPVTLQERSAFSRALPWLLLLGPLERPLAKVLRVVYYVAWAVALIVAIGGTASAIVWNWQYLDPFGATIVALLVLVINVLCIGPVLLFRALIIALDRRQVGGKAST
jgi:hypothetical protein